ncbi:hypothetical protein KC334_g8883 [Hortaea werneckii]|nr:hypothetical protein KC334_g8883 [Hortaea werneckii]KAI7023436.1 hypothetical protein KC355_g1716 [Hortaea werneckii]
MTKEVNGSHKTSRQVEQSVPGGNETKGGDSGPTADTSSGTTNETGPIFWGNIPDVRARCDLSSPGFRSTVDALTSIVKTCGKSPFKEISFEVRGSTRPHLINLFPLLEMMRVTGFDPTTGSYEPRPIHFTTETGKSAKRQHTTEGSIFIMQSFTHGPLQADLESAFALPRRAREEGWTAQRFETEFKAFVKRKGKSPKPKKAKPKVKERFLSQTLLRRLR